MEVAEVSAAGWPAWKQPSPELIREYEKVRKKEMP